MENETEGTFGKYLEFIGAFVITILNFLFFLGVVRMCIGLNEYRDEVIKDFSRIKGEFIITNLKVKDIEKKYSTHYHIDIPPYIKYNEVIEVER